MNKTRLEAFSDGVIAIIITIMVLELRPPHGADWAAMRPLLPSFLSYVLDPAKRATGAGSDLHRVEMEDEEVVEAVQKGVKEVVFDRGQYLYHGRVKALADAARESGLSF